MKIDLRSPDLSSGQMRDLAATVRSAFRDVAHPVPLRSQVRWGGR